MKHWDWSAKGVVKCLGAQNESGKVNRNIPNGQSWQDMSWTLAKPGSLYIGPIEAIDGTPMIDI
jgi:hypothetical protein